MKKYGKIFMNGIIDENPTFRMVLGMCPTLAITTAASNGIGMGLAVTFVLIFSNLVISLLRKAIPDQIRIPTYSVSRIFNPSLASTKAFAGSLSITTQSTLPFFRAMTASAPLL